MLLQIVDEQMHPQTWHILLLWLFVIQFIDFANVSKNGVYRIFDHMHVAFPRIIIPQIIPSNQSYFRIIPILLKHVLRHQANHKCPESYFRKIPGITPPNHTSHATRFPDTGIFRNIIWQLLSRQMLSGVSSVMHIAEDLSLLSRYRCNGFAWSF